jgi:phage replication-related protein YjqB (UPF0714/DUF867 family)
MAFKAKIGTEKHRSYTTDEAIVEATKEDMVGLNINISKQKRALFKAKTATNSKTMQDVILEAITRYIES